MKHNPNATEWKVTATYELTIWADDADEAKDFLCQVIDSGDVSSYDMDVIAEAAPSPSAPQRQEEGQ